MPATRPMSLVKIAMDNSIQPSDLGRRMLRHTKASPYGAVKRPNNNKSLSDFSALTK